MNNCLPERLDSFYRPERRYSEPNGVASRRTLAGVRINCPARITMRSVPIWMAIFRASVAARLMAATDARRSGSLASRMPFTEIGSLPIPSTWYCSLHCSILPLSSIENQGRGLSLSIPYVAFVAGDTVFFEKVTVLVLKRAGPVMFFLVVDVNDQALLLAYSD